MFHSFQHYVFCQEISAFIHAEGEYRNPVTDGIVEIDISMVLPTGPGYVGNIRGWVDGTYGAGYYDHHRPIFAQALETLIEAGVISVDGKNYVLNVQKFNDVSDCPWDLK